MDILVENHGTLFLFRPVSRDGYEFLGSEFPAGEECTYFGDALVVEHRYARDTAQAMIDAGLSLE